MPLIETKGAASAQGFGEFAKTGVATYIEDVFSTYLYTGNGSSQTITNNIDTTTYGGLVWIKGRGGSLGHRFTDTARGTTKSLASNSDAAQATESTGLTAFGTTGFTIGADADYNTNSTNYVSWTFRKQAKFFDVVTYTGNGANRTISHNLGSVPGCIIIKRTDTTGDWQVYHRSLANTEYMVLNTIAAKATGATYWNSTTPTSTVFSLGTATDVNANGGTYVAYLFAHNAGGFGTAGTDNVISCGSYTGTGATGNSINLGFEPQFILFKVTSDTSDWAIADVMRGMSYSGTTWLYPNAASADGATTPQVVPTATGFTLTGDSNACNGASKNYIYIAIRRGPMKTPTSGTSVYATDTRNAGSTGPRFTSGFPVDMSLRVADVTSASHNTQAWDRLRGDLQNLNTNSTDAETTLPSSLVPVFGFNTGIATLSSATSSSSNDRAWMFQRAPSFMDVVCYTGTGSSQTLNHNLGVAPEMIIFKSRNNTDNWYVATNFGASTYDWGYLNLDGWGNVGQFYAGNTVISAKPTATQFASNGGYANPSGYTMVAYLFASCAGVSKVGSYTGTGATQTISCGFAARFVMIKRRGGGFGSWWVWDTARGMVSGTDPRLATNSQAAQINDNWVYTDASGFQIVTTDATVNANGGSYIYLAIA